VGRARELAELDGLAAEPDATVVISAFSGTAGVGKTALAVHWAHRVANRFPGGQLYVNLRGFDPHAPAMEPAEALRDFLDALAVPSHQIPASLPARSALYRSLLAGQRMLVLLDNARDVEQVRPLLPGSAGCVVVVTSRNRLTGLIAGHAARPLTLDLLTPTEAVDLLAGRLGRERLRAHSGAVDEIVRRCAWLPLALTVVAAHAATHTDRPLVDIAAELGVPHTLDMLADEDPSTDVRSVLSWSYRALKPGAAWLFRLLGLHPGPDITGPAAASLAGVPVAEVGPLASDLVRAHLLTEHSPGRYVFHDLLRTYAGELATKVDSRPQRRAARQRMLDHYLHTAHAADRLLNPHRDRIALPAACAGAVPEAIADDADAMSWFGAEYRVLLAAVELAAQCGFDTHAWQLPAALASFQGRRGFWPDWVTSQRHGLEAARRLNDPTAQAHANRGLGRAYVSTNDQDNAIIHLRQARELFESLGERTAEAETCLNIGWTLGRQGRYREAVEPAQRALEIYRAAGHPTGQANAHAALGWYDINLGDHRRGIASCERALTLYREIGDRQGQAATLDSLGYAHGHLGHHDQAITYYREAVRLVSQLGDRYNEADVLARLGDTQHAAGQADAARDAWRRALTILDEIGHPTADQIRAKLGDPPPR
jgi:tetratricopeptide (TPR) repeat protein